MHLDIERGNKTLLEITNKYQNLTWGEVNIPVPYFINTAEQEYKKAMLETGIGEDLVRSIIQYVKDGNTLLGSSAGKGSPEETQSDIGHLMEGIGKQGYAPRNPILIRSWMVEMHVGLDCSGYVYNVLTEVEKDQELDILKLLAWSNPESIKPTHAGAFVFDSQNLKLVGVGEDLRPLDIFVRKDHTHVGILTNNAGALYLADCSMEKNGITFNKVLQTGNTLTIEGRDSWSEALLNNEIAIRRLEI